MINEDASQRRKLRVEKINRQRRKLKDQANLAIVKQPSSTSSAQRKEARKIRNRESAVASRKRKIEEYEIVQTRCGNHKFIRVAPIAVFLITFYSSLRDGE